LMDVGVEPLLTCGLLTRDALLGTQSLSLPVLTKPAHPPYRSGFRLQGGLSVVSVNSVVTITGPLLTCGLLHRRTQSLSLPVLTKPEHPSYRSGFRLQGGISVVSVNSVVTITGPLLTRGPLHRRTQSLPLVGSDNAGIRKADFENVCKLGGGAAFYR